jgi:hypothetical protein
MLMAMISCTVLVLFYDASSTAMVTHYKIRNDKMIMKGRLKKM